MELFVLRKDGYKETIVHDHEKIHINEEISENDSDDTVDNMEKDNNYNKGDDVETISKVE